MESMMARLAACARAGPDPEAVARLHRFVEAATAVAGGVSACVPDAEAEARSGCG